MITRELLVAQLERDSAILQRLPVSSGILKFLADEIRADAPWVKKAAKAWEKREFSAADLWSLIVASLHFEALNNAKCPLVRYFPSCGGTAEADPAPALKAFLADPPPSFYEHLRVGEVRAYSRFNSAFWTGPAQMFFAEREMDYYLVEVNSGAGLNLIGDAGVRDFDHELVAARVGLDSRPLLMEDITDRRWMTGCMLPDNIDGITDLDQATETLLAERRRDPSFVQLAACPLDKSAKFIARNIPPGDAEVGLLVMNARTAGTMTAQAYQAYGSSMVELLKFWGDRALWAECEFLVEDTSQLMLHWSVHRVVGGVLRTARIGRFDFSAQKHSIDLEKAQPFFAA